MGQRQKAELLKNVVSAPERKTDPVRVEGEEPEADAEAPEAEVGDATTCSPVTGSGHVASCTDPEAVTPPGVSTVSYPTAPAPLIVLPL